MKEKYVHFEATTETVAAVHKQNNKLYCSLEWSSCFKKN